jgi:hypothetical protein
MWEGDYSINTLYVCINGKMIPVETILAIGARRDKGE